jgi:hypothetical protein
VDALGQACSYYTGYTTYYNHYGTYATGRVFDACS